MVDRVLLMRAGGSFHARVVAARLACEGIPSELRGLSEGPYPLPGEVAIFVAATDVELAREVLLADAVDAVFALPPPRVPRRRRRRSLRRRGKL